MTGTPASAPGPTPRQDTASARRVVVGIGELAVSTHQKDVIVTHGLGSCVAVCVFDPIAAVAAMLHFLLPEAAINEERARAQPAAFADTGIALLMQTAAAHGVDRKRAIVKLIGGAELGESHGVLQIGRRNVAAAQSLLSQLGVLVTAMDTGGDCPRTVHLSAQDGRVRIFSGDRMKEL